MIETCFVDFERGITSAYDYLVSRGFELIELVEFDGYFEAKFEGKLK